MKTQTHLNRADWMTARLGKITGTGVGDIINKGGITKDAIVKELEEQKIEFKKAVKKDELEKLLSPGSKRKLESQLEKKLGFFKLVAERLSVSEEDFDGYVPNETPLARGTRMQPFAIERFKKETGKKVNEELVLWSRDDEPSIAVSPDGVISKTESVETKCLSSARHAEVYFTKTIPEEYYYQTLQYFVVNDLLETLYVVFYDPRLPAINYFVIEIDRNNILVEISELLEHQKNVIKEVDALVKSVTF